MSNVPIELLTSQNLSACAWAIKARNKDRQPMTEKGQVLYDYCMENGIIKLAPNSCWWDNTDSYVTAHRWLVYWKLGHTQNVPNLDAVLAVQNWIREPTEANKLMCVSMAKIAQMSSDWAVYYLLDSIPNKVRFWYMSDRIVTSYRLLIALNKHLPEPFIESSKSPPSPTVGN